MLVRALRGLFAFEFRGKPASGNHEFINGSFAAYAFVGVIEKQLNPAFEQILNDEARTERVPTKTRFVTHDHRVELFCFRRVEKRNEPRAFFELRA